VAICPGHLHQLDHDAHRIQRDKCIACFSCVSGCYSGALEVSGRRISVEEIMRQILPDQPFYAASGGGVTLSGGEPLMQPRFSKSLLQACKSAGLHTTVQTCAEASWANIVAIIPFVDLFLIDLKVLDPNLHQKVTGKSNQRILTNIRRLAQTDKALSFRIPVVPGVNDAPEIIAAMAGFIHDLRGTRLPIELVPFHRLATDKYRSLDLTYQAATLAPLSVERMNQLKAVIIK